MIGIRCSPLSPGHPRRFWREVDEITTAIAQSECLRGAVRTNHKESCPDGMILFGEDALRKSVQEFTAHYHHFERNHKGLCNRPILADSAQVGSSGEIRRRARLGEMGRAKIW
jgi:hypothetical protein